MRKSDIIPITAPVDELSVAVVQMNDPLPEVKLNPTEKSDLSSIRSEFRKKEYLVSRWLLKLLAENNGIDPVQLRIHKESSGRPFGRVAQRDYHVGISHSGNYVAAALCFRHRIGLDIERTRRSVSNRLRKRILHPDEVVSLEALSTVQIWTIKESVLKLIGLGLRINMNSLVIHSVPTETFTTTWRNKSVRIFPFEIQEIVGSISIFEEDL